MSDINTLVPWYGSNRKLRRAVGRELDGWNFVAVPFAGGMCELPEFRASSILANDKHRHLINLARVVRNHRRELIDRLDAQIFDPDTLAAAQLVCLAHESTASAGLFGAQAITAPDIQECGTSALGDLIGSPANVKTAYRVLAKRMHPDVDGGSDEMFKLLSEAKRALDAHGEGGDA